MIDLAKGKFWGKSWSPVKGCAPGGFGKGCAHCWAGNLAKTRLSHVEDFKDAWSDTSKTGWNGYVNCCDHHLHVPNGNDQVIALNWMGDLFNPGVPFAFIEKVFALMLMRRQHTFLLLTKLPWRLKSFMLKFNLPAEAVDHIFFGTSVSTQSEWDKNVQQLLEVPGATRRWVSMEPLLEEIDICNKSNVMAICRKVSRGEYVEWIVVGAESGPGARPMDLGWAEEIIGECKATGILPFYKQGPDEHGIEFKKAPSIFGGPHVDLPFDLPSV